MKKKATNSIELTFPKVVSVDDYHQFGEIVDYIEELTGKKIKYIELGDFEDNFDMPNYVALFYIGKRLTKKEIETNLKKWIN